MQGTLYVITHQGRQATFWDFHSAQCHNTQNHYCLITTITITKRNGTERRTLSKHWREHLQSVPLNLHTFEPLYLYTIFSSKRSHLICDSRSPTIAQSTLRTSTAQALILYLCLTVTIAKDTFILKIPPCPHLSEFTCWGNRCQRQIAKVRQRVPGCLSDTKSPEFSKTSLKKFFPPKMWKEI